MPRPILLIDDDPDLLALLELELRQAGFSCVLASTGAEALALVVAERPAAAVLDLHLPDRHGRELLTELRADHPGVGVVVLSAEDAIDEVVECMRLGATDYVSKPFDRTRLVTSVQNAIRQAELASRVETLTRELRSGEGLGTILGESAALRSSVDLLRRAAQSDVTLLLTGESGTGKGVAARAVHADSARRSGPFVAANLGAIPDTLLESALFGHERGAFTGATRTQTGLFEDADGGTLFLDEIGELRRDLQVRLLSVLQERTVQRVGSTRSRPVDVRVVAATNRDLPAMVAADEFREDLYYRLAVFPVVLPPLRDRAGDVETLAAHFVAKFAAQHGRAVEGFTEPALEAIRRHSWPGNVREVENALERALLLEDGPKISLGSLPDAVVAALDVDGSPKTASLDGTTEAGAPATDRDDIRTLAEHERDIILDALERCGWSAPTAAERLGIGRATIYRKMERYGIKRDDG